MRSIKLLIVFSLFLSPLSYAICQSGIPLSTPGNELIDNGDGTVSDTATGLMWKQCSEGQGGTDCAGSATIYNWQSALQQAQSLNASGGFAGFTDWRLPNVKELRSLVEEACYDPSINEARFPNTPSMAFWSSSASAYNSSHAWYVHFYGSSALGGDRSLEANVRLVRGGQ